MNKEEAFWGEIYMEENEKQLKNLNIEQSMEEINRIIAALESGSLTLEDSMKQFEQGIYLINQCAGIIDGAERQMKILRESGDGAYVFAETERKDK